LRRRYLDKIQDDGTFDKSTQIVLNEVDSLKNLVSEFSNFARMPDIQQVPENLNQLALEAISLYRAAHDSILFDVILEDSIGELRLDKSQIKRALINIFDNSVAAMSGVGTITVTTFFDKTQGVTCLKVKDTGCGIDEEVYGHLFEPYFSTKQGGTGLGLAIVHRIISDHGGFIRVSSNSNSGTEFLIEFPESLKINPPLGPEKQLESTWS
jgi:two-component system nitrogen regulation sensor histidine kinase NtrY